MACIVLALLIIGVGLRRIYLGVHYPSDVPAGYISGGFRLVSPLSGTDIYDRCARLLPAPVVTES